MPWSNEWKLIPKPYSQILREHNKIGDDFIKKAAEELKLERLNKINDNLPTEA